MLMGVCFGYGTAPINPFTVGLAQSIAGLPLFSGMWYRWILWGVSAVVAVAFLIHYCRKVKADPSKSLVADLDYSEFCLEDVGETKLTKRQGAVLTCFFGGIILLMAMIVLKGWYMTELSAYFFGLALVCGLVYGMSLNEMARHFVDGMKDMVYPAILVGIAGRHFYYYGKWKYPGLHSQCFCAASFPHATGDKRWTNDVCTDSDQSVYSIWNRTGSGNNASDGTFGGRSWNYQTDSSLSLSARRRMQ